MACDTKVSGLWGLKWVRLVERTAIVVHVVTIPTANSTDWPVVAVVVGVATLKALVAEA